MSLPDFLIIGARKSGTTWLYDVLKSHSKIKMAIDRKEVHFFDRYYDRGIEWYKSKFPDDFKEIIGEATPNYLSDNNCAFRINRVLPEVKLICILRNPVDRAYSAYKYLVQEKNYNNSFEQAIEEYPDILKRGLYYEQLQDYLDYFDRKDLKVLIFEEVIANKEEKIKEICRFLGANENFDTEKLYEKSNVSQVPRFKLLYSIGKKIVRKLYDYDIVFLVNTMKKLGIKELLLSDKNNNFQPMNDKIKSKLKKYYYKDVNKLEKLLGKNLKGIWEFNLNSASK